MKKTLDLTDKEKEFLYCMTDNCFSDILESEFEFTFAVTDELSYPESSARGVISSLIKKGLIEVTEQEDDHPVVSFTAPGKHYTKKHLEELKEIKEKNDKNRKVIESIGSDRIYTVNEVADILQITPQKLRKYLRSAGYEKQPTGKYGFNPSQVEIIKEVFKA